MPDHDKNLMLSIESGVMGGSVALVDNAKIVDCWVGPTGSSRAEDLLVAIDDVCGRSVGGTAGIDRIAVSIGPGSYTGLRIGIATAMGLARGTGVECVGIPVLDALAALAGEEREVISAVPMGRSDICYQHFDAQRLPKSKAASVSLQAFEEIVVEFPDAQLVVPESLKDLRSKHIQKAGNCIAQHIAALAANRRVNYGTNPIYVQNPRMI